jgi:hypothetical protein
VRTGEGDDDALKPPYQMSFLDDSVITGMAKVISSPDEGLLSLWKGNTNVNELDRIYKLRLNYFVCGQVITLDGFMICAT